MRQTLPLGRIAGIRIGVHWSVFVIMLLLAQGLALTVLPRATAGQSQAAYWLLGVAGAILFLASLLAHELSHALVARAYGIHVEQITLWLLGGVAEFQDEPETARADLLIAGAGPLTSAVSGVVFGVAALIGTATAAPPVVIALFDWLAGINLLVAAFNLLPGAPLDGGRVLRGLLWRWRHDRTWAALTATRVGHALGVILVFVGLAALLLAGRLDGLWLALVGWFLLSASNAEANATRLRAVLGRVPVSAVMHTDLRYGDPQQSVADFIAVAATSPQRLFPLRNHDGGPAGLVRLSDLTAVPEDVRGRTTLAAAGLPASAVPVVDTNRFLADVAPVVFRGRAALVTDHGALVGLLTSEDVEHAAERAALRGPFGRVA